MSAGGFSNICATKDSNTHTHTHTHTHTLSAHTHSCLHTHTVKRTDAGLPIAGEHEAAHTLAAEGSGLVAADGVGSAHLRSLAALVSI